MICSESDELNETLHRFKNDLNSLRMLVTKKTISKKKFSEVIERVFENSPNKYASVTSIIFVNKILRYILLLLRILLNFILYIAKTSLSLLLALAFIYLLATNHNATQKFLTRNSQSFIYPVMRTVRLWTLPVIRRYHSLTDWHEEDCLVKNPFYQDSHLDCWPCEDVRTMVDLTGLNNYSQAYVFNEKPFLARDVMKFKFTLNNLTNVIREHKKKLERGTAKFSSSHPSIKTLEHFFRSGTVLTSLSMENFHILWKINRVAGTRVLRQAFQRPYFVPRNSEVALQRYLCISGSEAPQFFLPITDFANVWVAQGQGYRLIVLDPSDTCKNNCSTLSVLLRPKDVLYYNWQFWKPRSLPARLSEDASITYIGSFY